MRALSSRAGAGFAGCIAIGMLAAIATGPAAASVPHPTALPREAATDGTVRIEHRLSRRLVPTSPYYSYGYPRLYYHPWGLSPHARTHRWFHR